MSAIITVAIAIGCGSSSTESETPGQQPPATSWTGPEVIASGLEGANFATALLAPEGDALLVWSAASEGSAEVGLWVADRRSRRPWRAPRQVGSTASVQRLEAVLLDRGQAMLAWQTGTEPGARVRALPYTLGGDSGVAETLAAPAEAPMGFGLAGSSSGGAVVAWSESVVLPLVDGVARVQSRRWRDDAWGDAVSARPLGDGWTQDAPWVELDDRGELATVIWTEGSSSGMFCGAGQVTAGASFTPPRCVARSVAFDEGVRFGGPSIGHALWGEYTADDSVNDPIRRYARFEALEGGWSRPETLNDGRFFNAASRGFAVDKTGGRDGLLIGNFAGMFDAQESTLALRAGVWRTPVDIDVPPLGVPNHANGRSTVSPVRSVVVLATFEDERSHLWGLHSPDSETWSPPELLLRTERDPSFEWQLVGDGAAGALLAWRENGTLAVRELRP